MRKIYVCHPYQGSNALDIAAPERNAKTVAELCRAYWKRGDLPVAPQIYLPRFVNDKRDRQAALEACIRLMVLCDEVHVWGDEVSPGMETELRIAAQYGMIIRTKSPALVSRVAALTDRSEKQVAA
jgi:hypothetical protein